MSAHQIVAVLILISVSNIKGFYVGVGKSTRMAASIKCDLAMPPLSYTDNGITVDANYTELGLSPGEKYWLGYTMTTQVFVYKGCVSVDEILQYHPHTEFTTRADPGDCWSVCNATSIIGLSAINNECYCFEDEPDFDDDQLDSCDRRCTNPAYSWCGGTTAVSLYKAEYGIKPGDVLEMAGTASKGKDNCIVYGARNNMLSMSPCNRNNYFVCKTGTKKGDVYQISKTWRDAAAYCLDNGDYPLDYGVIEAIKKPSTLNITFLWTGMLRTRVLLNTYALQKEGSTLSVYCRVDNGNIRIIFEPKEKTLRSMKYLCEGEALPVAEAEAEAEAEWTDGISSFEHGVFWGLMLPLILVAILAAYVFWRRRQDKSLQVPPRRHKPAIPSEKTTATGNNGAN